MLSLFILCVPITFVCANSYFQNCFIKRYAVNEGFHRNVTTQVEFTSSLDRVTVEKTCRFILTEQLPASLYVDIYQLGMAVPFGGPQILADGVIDTESAEHNSVAYKLYVYTSDHVHISNTDNGRQINLVINMPVHLRYHRPANQPDVSEVTVTLTQPLLYQHCTGENVGADDVSVLAPCDYTNSSLCLWSEMSCQYDQKQLTFTIPIGNQNELTWVTMGTIITTVLACVYLIHLSRTTELAGLT